MPGSRCDPRHYTPTRRLGRRRRCWHASSGGCFVVRSSWVGGLMAKPKPVYDSGPSDRSEQRRILLFAYHFPPDQVAGALRWQKLATHALDRGWGLDAITLD